MVPLVQLGLGNRTVLFTLLDLQKPPARFVVVRRLGRIGRAATFTAGTLTTCSQFGHLTRRPAALSGTRSRLLQFEQVSSIGIKDFQSRKPRTANDITDPGRARHYSIPALPFPFGVKLRTVVLQRALRAFTVDEGKCQVPCVLPVLAARYSQVFGP